MDQLTLSEAQQGVTIIPYLLLSQLKNAVSKRLTNIVL